jgi:CRP/FNR family transcriptional regulator, cyclic AMP receptor protein
MTLDLGPFEDLPAPARQVLEQLASPVRAYARGERVVVQGDPADAVHVVQSGHVGAEVTDPTTLRTHLVAVLGRGSLFGEIALLDAGQRRTATIVAFDAVRVASLPSDALTALRGRNADIDRVLVGVLTDYVVRLTDQLTLQRFASADARMRGALCDLHAAFDRGEIAMTQEQLSDIAGLARATTNELLGALERDGLIARRGGRVSVLDHIGLLRSAGRL